MSKLFEPDRLFERINVKTRSFRIEETACALEISQTTGHEIIRNLVGHQKVSASQLTEDHKGQFMTSSYDTLKRSIRGVFGRR